MIVLTKIEKMETRLRKKLSRCERLSNRHQELMKMGYQTSDAKQITADEEGITLVHLYNLLKWYANYKKENE